ncbi:hypothetical protein Dsin_011510 [Dipteronia sinensis]|uniref:Uncharacterized protein n=1 Tax=Dipteronia sinensis TaxID=43782 RepID=A0AAE0EFE9_9ROSI|nr:hypothetical protein Dsin_011510 [Dipteronia sinensis]
MIDKMVATSNLKEFSFKELKMATGNFSPDAWLADGDLCKVYKGWMDEKALAPSKSGDGMVVAIKDFNTKKEQHFELWQVFHLNSIYCPILEIFNHLKDHMKITKKNASLLFYPVISHLGPI